MPTKPRLNSTELNEISMGQRGFTWIDNTTSYSGEWVVIQALTATTFTVLQGDDITLNGVANSNLNGKVLPAGQTLWGRFNTIQLTSGSIIALNV